MEMELCNKILKYGTRRNRYLPDFQCCALKLCMRNKVYQDNFEICFAQQYSMVDTLSYNHVTNVAKVFAYLLYNNALSWHVLACISLTIEEVTPHSLKFIETLFQQLYLEYGTSKLNARLNDPEIQASVASIFRKDLPKNTKYAIDFFRCAGLDRIIGDLIEYSKMSP